MKKIIHLKNEYKFVILFCLGNKEHWDITRRSHLKYMIPHRGTSTLNVEVCVAVFHTDETVFGHFGLPQQCIVRPVIFHPGQLPNYLRTLNNTGHSRDIKRRIVNIPVTKPNEWQTLIYTNIQSVYCTLIYMFSLLLRKKNWRNV